MDREHRRAGVQEPVDQQAVRPFDPDQLDLEIDQPPAQRADPALVMPIAATLHDPPVFVDHAARMLLAGPFDASKTTTHNRFLPSRLT